MSLASNILKVVAQKIKIVSGIKRTISIKPILFRKDVGTQDAISSITLYIDSKLGQGLKVHADFLEIYTAFDSININILLEIMTQAKIPYLYIKIMVVRQLTHGPTTISTGSSEGTPLS